MKNLKYYPEEIAKKLCSLANKDDDYEIKEQCIEAIYQLLAMAENEYNADYWRVLYNVLQEVASTGIKEEI